MFRSARIKLTAWYLLIIMSISISFSVAIYKVLTLELERFERVQRLRIEHFYPEQSRVSPSTGQRGEFLRASALDLNLVTETEERIKIILAIINMTILGASATTGYFLAGRTLKPIKEMVDEQNRFITDSSHELRTPLTSLKTEIEVSLRDKKLNLEEARDLLKSNLEEVNNLQTLSDGLIKLTQYQKGENGLSFNKVSLTDIIEEAIKKITVLAKSKNIKIASNVENTTIEANQTALTELFVIFLDNAIKYSPEKTEITLSTEKSEGQAVIHIKDTGLGISEDDLPHLFDRFFRSDKSRTKGDVPGYGLGLSIAKQIVDKHNGSIKVQSKLGEGTTFTIHLPTRHVRRMI